MTPVGQRSDKSSLKSQACVWLPAEVSHISPALLNRLTASPSYFKHVRTAVPVCESIKVSHSSQIGHTEPRLAISSGREPQHMLFLLVAPSASHVQILRYKKPWGRKKCIILSIASETCHMCQCSGGMHRMICRAYINTGCQISFVFTFACAIHYLANLGEGVGRLTYSTTDSQYRLPTSTYGYTVYILADTFVHSDLEWECFSVGINFSFTPVNQIEIESK